MTGPRTPASSTAGWPPPGLLVLVAAGGAVGALLRWGVGEWIGGGAGFPWATLAINISGSALLSLLLVVLPRLLSPRRERLATAALGPGVLGGFTTLSTFAEETRALVAHGHAWQAGAYLGLTVGCCLAAVHLVRLALPDHREVVS